jgi:hypothetical protein
MASNDYQFITEWQIPATPEEITEILSDAEALERWWPSVYLGVTEIEPGDQNGIGKKVELYTKGWLPYTLRWTFEVTESDPPRGFTIVASGDFVGRGIWTLEPQRGVDAPDGPMTLVRYDWKIAAEKFVLRNFSFIAKPVFAANHHWAMARGQESLRLEVARRHAAAAGDQAILAAIPAPPGETFGWLRLDRLVPARLRRR